MKQIIKTCCIGTVDLGTSFAFLAQLCSANTWKCLFWVFRRVCYNIRNIESSFSSSTHTLTNNFLVRENWAKKIGHYCIVANIVDSNIFCLFMEMWIVLYSRLAPNTAWSQRRNTVTISIQLRGVRWEETDIQENSLKFRWSSYLIFQ